MTFEDGVLPRALGEVSTWHLESDVVVVGYGGAGVCAALTAARSGVDVMAIERTGGPGGSAAVSAGYLYLGGGTSLQRACGFEDTPENMFAFLMAATGPDPNEAKLRIYCERSVEHFEWVQAQGVPFKASLFDEPAWEALTDDGLAFSGGEKAHPFCEIATPAPRAHIPQMANKVMGERSSGWLLMNALTEQAAKAGVKVESDLRVDRLVVDSDGAVAGVIGRRFGEDVAIRARRGVVLAAGGFAANREMLARHSPRLVGAALVGTDTDDGRGIQMAQAVGASVRHMDAAEAGAHISPVLLVRSLLVNPQGVRFVNEDTYPGRVGQMALYRQDGALAVFDERTYEGLSKLDRYGWKPDFACATIEELEAESGLPPGSLEATVSYFNEHAARGDDPQFHKDPRWVRPLEPPFGAVDLRGGASRFGIFTLGGLETTIDGEVLDLDGRPIAGLYAAGRTTSGVPAWGYLSGTSLGDATFFGRRAGGAAARAG